MSYTHAVEQLYALGAELATGSGTSVRRKFSLDEMRHLMAALGNPQQQFRSVLIAGTNGKGSTAAMLASIAQDAGYRVGLYTSPHLTRVNERIRINGIDISDDDFARLYFRVDETGAALLREGTLPQHPSFFESITAVAFLYFAEQKIDLAVLEVGMGGRLDATNIIDPLLSIITDISLDHTEWLGDTIAAIAREKAGILRPNGVLITLPQHPEANQALGEVAVALNVTGVNAAAYMPATHTVPGVSTGNRYPVALPSGPAELALPLAGEHQIRNAALAIAAAHELCNRYSYNIHGSNIIRGIAAAHWPGRLEFFPPTSARCGVLLDAAHNPAGAWALRSALGQRPEAHKTLLFGCLRDKAYTEMAQILFPVFDHIVLTPVDSPRSLAGEELLAIAQATGVPATLAASPIEGLTHAIAATPQGGIAVCAGSIYLIGNVRPQLAERSSL
jgi:dihydrofolate synthase/folylpolyglutamate synthase